MSAHGDLLQQAFHLATIDAKKPKQANLRRAVSSAYYAVFHLLIDEACRVQFGTQHHCDLPTSRARSHIRTTPSGPPVTTNRPSEENAAQ